MKYFLFLIIILPLKSQALDAVVTVLEAPVFRGPDINSPVVQYYRKGDVFKIHPSVGNDKNIEKFAPSDQKRAEFKTRLKALPEYDKDPLFKGEEENTFYLDDEFIPTIDRSGKTAYVLSKHIFVYFNDARELGQKIIVKDPTDYRLEDPLPPKYPLRSITGYRGLMTVGFTQPYYESYPYKEKATTKGYRSPLDLNLTMMKLAPGNYQERLFIGGSLNFKSYENSFSFIDRRVATETGYKFGLGPTISYDAFKGEKNRINLSGSVIVNILDRLYIEQNSNSRLDSRVYGTYSVAPRFNIQYHRKQILKDLDLVLGSLLEIGLPASYQAKNAGRETSWWRHLGNDKFTTRTTFSLGGHLGIQSAY